MTTKYRPAANKDTSKVVSDVFIFLLVCCFPNVSMTPRVAENRTLYHQHIGTKVTLIYPRCRMQVIKDITPDFPLLLRVHIIERKVQHSFHSKFESAFVDHKIGRMMDRLGFKLRFRIVSA